MDPLTLGIGAVGLGMQLFGAFSGSSNAQHAAAIQQQIGGVEMQINDQKRQAMELSATRQKMEIYRTSQRARATALANATSQGASYGNSSGLQGGYGQIAGQTGTNLNGVNQNLMISRNIFGFNDQISGLKQQLGGVQSDMAFDQGISSIGGSLMGAAGTLSKIGGYASAPSGPMTLGGPMGPTPFGPKYS